MKQLTQAIFSGQPSWVKSAAVNGSNGIAGLFDVEARYLNESSGYWGYHKYFPMSEQFRHIKAGSGFNTKNWRRSAIDREVAK